MSSFETITHLASEQPEATHESRVNERYGDAAKAGWQPLPDVLLFHQKDLKLKSEDLNVLLNLMAHYYRKEEMPFIRPNVIAKRMGVSMRSVQRSITRLRQQGHIDRYRHPKHKRIVHDLTPLIERLRPFAEMRLADRERRRLMNSGVAQMERAPGFDGQDRSADRPGTVQVRVLPPSPPTN